MAVTTSSEHTVDVLGANSTSSVTKVQPSNGTGTIGASISGRRGRNSVELLARQVHRASGEVKSRDTLGVEEVVAKERDRTHVIKLKRSIRREWIGRGGTGEAGVGTTVGRRVEIEGDLMAMESLGRQSSELLTAKRTPSSARVKARDIVQHSEGTSGGGCSANFGASVVLDTEAKSDVLELGASRRVWQVLTCEVEEKKLVNAQ